MLFRSQHLFKTIAMPKYNIDVQFLGKKFKAKNVIAPSFEDAVAKVKNTFKVTGGKEVEGYQMPNFNENDIVDSFEQLMYFLKNSKE